MKFQPKIAAIFVLATILLALPCASNAATFSTNSFSDAFVATGASGSLSVSNFGSAGALALAASDLPLGEFQSAVQFDLSGARNAFNSQFGAGQWAIQSVTLRLTSSPHNNAIFNNIAAGQFNVSLLRNNSWIEGTGSGGVPSSDGISFSTLQSTYIDTINDQSLGTFSFPGGSSGANTYSLTLSSGVIADIMDGDDLSLRLYAADANVSYLFSSRTGNGAPTLSVTAVPEPGSLGLCVSGLAMLSLWRFGLRLKRRSLETPP